MADELNIHAITRTYPNIARVITTSIAVQNLFTNETGNTGAIWDTGATNSVITEKFSKKLNLIPIGQTVVNGVHGPKTVNVYPIKITLNNENVSFTLQVTECSDLTDDGSCEFLIGMDIISKGDFAISNFGGRTVMTFRTPSVQIFDFVQSIKSNTPIVSEKPIGRNDPCICGSGKKFKHCHGR